MTSLADIRSALIGGTFTNSELDEVAQVLRYARSQLGKRTIRSIRTGDTVKFTSPRTGATFHGTVDKVKIKYILVATPQGRYNVPANLVEAI